MIIKSYCLFAQDLMLLLQDLLTSWAPKQTEQGLVHLSCHCKSPGRELQCEDCPYLEALLSRTKSLSNPALR